MEIYCHLEKLFFTRIYVLKFFMLSSTQFYLTCYCLKCNLGNFADFAFRILMLDCVKKPLNFLFVFLYSSCIKKEKKMKVNSVFDFFIGAK